MAAEDEGRTEEPSETRLQKAREEGRVAKSQEIGSSLVLLLCVIVLVIMGKFIFSQCLQVYRFFFERVNDKNISYTSYLWAFFSFFLKIIIPIGIVSIIAGVLANIIQNKGFIYSWKPITPKFSNIVPKFGEYFRKTLFSGKGLFNIAKSIGKVALIILVAYINIKADLFVLIEIIRNGQILAAVGKIAWMAVKILLIVAVLFLIISIPDYFVQKKEFMESMKMTKQEQKQEYKELEGDPVMKSRLIQMQRQMLARDIRKAVAESDVVIANPTHFAVALKYDPVVDKPPVVTAEGVDNQALYMRRLAKENDIPVVENRPLARLLYTELEVGDIIPNEYIRAVSSVYAYIMKETGKDFINN